MTVKEFIIETSGIYRITYFENGQIIIKDLEIGGDRISLHEDTLNKIMEKVKELRTKRGEGE